MIYTTKQVVGRIRHDSSPWGKNALYLNPNSISPHLGIASPHLGISGKISPHLGKTIIIYSGVLCKPPSALYSNSTLTRVVLLFELVVMYLVLE